VTGSRNLVLTGFMGTGKTSVGRQLAARLGMEFVDTDELLEARHGPIEQIFAEQGETAFRDLEREMARELSEREGLVIATGGRMMLDPANVDQLGGNAQVFCLVASPEEIHRRVGSDEIRGERPLLNVEDPSQEIAQLLEDRDAGYRRFRQIPTDGRDVASIADEIVSLWRDSVAENDSPAKMDR
jgi:shikimate kinase